MIDHFINFVIRPPRAEYIPDQYLWESEFTMADRKYKRQDLELTNVRGHTLQCSHYVPDSLPEDTALPCVIYCHGNSGCRADANEAAVILLPLNITVFTLDFSGSGLSGGDYVSLGWHEKDDLRSVVQHLRSDKHVSCIGLWGRSMGAVTCLLYGAEDPSIAGMALDSAFANLFDLMMELVDVYKIRLPKFTVKMALHYMRRVIQKKASFDILDLNTLQSAPKTFIPALFGHASDDIFIQPRHSSVIYNSYAGDKNIIQFDGDHNSPRPQFYYDSVLIFFYNVLRPPQISSISANKLEKYCDLGGIKIGTGMDESLLYEIIAGLRASGNHAPCSSSDPSISKGTIVKSVVELLAEGVAHMSVEDEVNFLLDQEKANIDASGSCGEEFDLQDKSNEHKEECCSYSSSNRESWGMCSSLGGSEESSTAECIGNPNVKHQTALKALSMPLRRIQRRSVQWKEKKKGLCESKKTKETKTEKGKSFSQRLRHSKAKDTRTEKGESLSQRLQHSIMKRVNHRRLHSSSQ